MNIFAKNIKKNPGTLVVVDIQPGYIKSIRGKFDIQEFLNYLLSFKDIIYLYVGDSVGIDTEYSLKQWLDEEADYDEKFMDYIDQHAEFYDKGYAFFRDMMDNGVDEEEMIITGKYMYKHDIVDARDLTENDWNKMSNVDNLKENIQRKNFFSVPVGEYFVNALVGAGSPITMIGGGRYECLKEVEILMNIINKKYKINENFVY